MTTDTLVFTAVQSIMMEILKIEIDNYKTVRYNNLNTVTAFHRWQLAYLDIVINYKCQSNIKSMTFFKSNIFEVS